MKCLALVIVVGIGLTVLSGCSAKIEGGPNPGDLINLTKPTPKKDDVVESKQKTFENQLKGDWYTECKKSEGTSYAMDAISFSGDTYKRVAASYSDSNCNSATMTIEFYGKFVVGEYVDADKTTSQFDYTLENAGGMKVYDVLRLKDGQLNLSAKAGQTPEDRPKAVDEKILFLREKAIAPPAPAPSPVPPAQD